MNKKGGIFFEEHVEKIVLAVIGVVCIWLLIFRVLVSPNRVPYGSDKFAPGVIDNRINEQARDLADKLERRPKPKEEYKPRLGEFAARVESAISVNRELVVPLPALVSTTQVGDIKYNVPAIGEVHDVAVEHIRAAAYLPTTDVDEENDYDQGRSEPNDIDFVTVEAEFDVASLCKSFYESFAGEDLPPEWRDPCLARPVFAAVQLERQELLPDGRWSHWQDVPRARIDAGKKMFKVIEYVENLPPGGVRVRMFQLDESRVRMDLLQPEAYRIASAEQEWFPPLVHKEFVKFQRKLEAEERREAREAEKQEQERRRGQTVRGRERERYGERDRYRERQVGRSDERELRRYGERRGRGRDYRMRDRAGARSGRMRFPGRVDRDEERWEEETARGKKDTSKTPSINQFYDELEKILLTDKVDISQMREPLVLWAHDDTVEAGKTYRYRIRLGVFNPIAGTSQFSEQCESLKNRVILWSEFSDITEAVHIPQRLYFFPLSMQQAAKVVTVKVSKYVLGYWHGDNFSVQQGEIIGKVRENKDLKSEDSDDQTEAVEKNDVPETIDYTTGVVLVDVATVNEWSAGGRQPRPRYYSDMLYSFDGTTIERLPIKVSHWPKDLQVKFSEIKRSEEMPRKPFRAFGAKRAASRLRRRRGEEDREEEERERWE